MFFYRDSFDPQILTDTEMVQFIEFYVRYHNIFSNMHLLSIYLIIYCIALISELSIFLVLM